ncbi:MAG: hypothetical protein JRI23_04640 [Deltaproteobacteria bacterium]|jgi:hypothetical protein|nr:hypothetical protein [Deltaproteobacteria bacterium]MBW2530836.1 hypothetical protein [Deltaproteobacteria bacterium]
MVTLVAAALSGCGDRCADLQDVCDLCEDPYHKATCESSVDADDGERCDRDVSNYCSVCGRDRTGQLDACR